MKTENGTNNNGGRRKRHQAPQFDFAFACEVFNLEQQTVDDGAREIREREELDSARSMAELDQHALPGTEGV